MTSTYENDELFCDKEYLFYYYRLVVGGMARNSYLVLGNYYRRFVSSARVSVYLNLCDEWAKGKDAFPNSKCR
jgi:hypothetical protein